MRKRKFQISLIIVGIAVAVLLSLLLVLWKTGFFVRRESYYELGANFETVSGLHKNSPVWFRGKEVGYVKEVRALPNKIGVRFLIKSDVRIPEGSTAMVGFTGLFGEKYLEIIPSDSMVYVKPKSIIQGKTIVSWTELGEKGKVSLEEMRVSLEQFQNFLASLNKIIGDEKVQSSVKQNIYKMGEVEDETVETMNDIRDLAGQGKQTLVRVDKTVESLNEVIDSTFYNSLKRTVFNLETMSCALKRVADILDKMVGQEARQNNVKQTISNLNRVSKKAEKAVDNINKVFGDEELQKDIKETVSNLKELSRSVKKHPWKLLWRW